MKENKIHFQQEQANKLEELGSYLRQCRTQQSLSLEEVTALTRIPARLLHAIEEGRLEDLPEPVYIQGFIKIFAEALGLNGAELASAFPTGITLEYKKNSWRRLPAAQLRPLHLYLIYIFVVICAVSGLSLLVRRSAVRVVTREDYLQQTANFVELSNLQQQLETVEPVFNNSPSQNKPVQVDVTLQERSWIRVVADGKTEFEDILPEGTQRTWVAEEKLIIRAGNAGGVLVEFNDNISKRMGAPGAVEELTFAANPRS
ncbi:MAG: helix-turn-helix domain-containing protein [Symploca sp. SIO3C6]|nr:helix-turn-helix domain-containing protein [Symploca sp. SIO3C6]NET03491.1 helix-turn-helix domain-containing protein [Symploca sp. SIO2B6]